MPAGGLLRLRSNISAWGRPLRNIAKRELRCLIGPNGARKTHSGAGHRRQDLFIGRHLAAAVMISGVS